MTRMTNELTCPHTSDKCDGIQCSQHGFCPYYTSPPSLLDAAACATEQTQALDFVIESLECIDNIPDGVLAMLLLIHDSIELNAKLLRRLIHEQKSSLA